MQTEMMDRPAGSVSAGKLIAGLFFTAAGVLLTADNLDLLDADRYLRFWPALLILLGVLKLGDRGSSRVISVGLIAVGAWLLADNLYWFRFSIFDLWPLILIAAGVAIVARAVGVRAGGDTLEKMRSSGVAIFAARKVASTSPDFSGASAVAVLGGYELDLTGAGIHNGTAVIETFAFWGGVDIIVPDDWDVIGDVLPVMGGFEMQTGTAVDPAKRLIIRGAAIMGGVDVRSASRRKA